MIRVDIIANQSIEENVIDELTTLGHGESFSYIHPVYGRGTNGRREGSAVWPETNVMFVVFLDDGTADALAERIRTLRRQFPKEGIRCWVSEAPTSEI